MRTVLYTEDLWPIAIVELTPNEEEILTNGSFIRRPYVPPMKILPYPEIAELPVAPLLNEIKIYGEWIRNRNGTPCLILFVTDDILKPQPALHLSELSL